MPLIQSLFCLQGADNRSRFYSIILVCYLSFLLLNAVVNNSVFSLLILAITAAISTLTTIRRLKDAQLKKAWLILSSGAYVLTALLIIFIENSYINWLILLPLMISALLLTYPSKQQKSYILGYAGPVDLSVYRSETNVRQRIEPTLLGHNEASVTIDTIEKQQASTTTNQPQTSTERDLGEQLRTKLLQQSKAILIGLASIAFIITLLAVIDTQEEATATQVEAIEKKTNSASTLSLERLSPLEMPDNFTLFLSQYDGVIVHWQATENQLQQLWSITSAQGDDSCKNITFNNNEQYRTLTVTVENNQDHYASFSPLDTKKLLKAMAFRGSFTICGFKFSLKGSQATLGKSNQYADFIDY